MTTCSVADCPTNAVTRGWCDKHYRRWKTHGDPLWERPKPKERKCEVAECPNHFTPKKLSDGKRFCSKRCEWVDRGGPDFSAAVARLSAPKRAAAQRGRGAGRSYRKLNGRHEHRVVAEQMLGRPLRRGEVVHHRDHNIHNNHPSNLEVITQREHMQRHGLGIPGVRPPWLRRKGVAA